MKILDLKQLFKDALSENYIIEEIENFFYMTLEHFFNLNKLDVILDQQLVLNKKESNIVFDVLKRLEHNEPIQYILGEAEFYGLKFKVSPDVLIPRQETEELVDLIINDAKQINVNALNVLDIGTGSGCISVCLAQHIKSSAVKAVDISKKALEIASFNANFNKANLDLIEKSVFDEDFITFFKGLKFDVIVSNPPYVRHSEKKEIHNNVLQNEPHLALFVPDDNPLMFYKRIAEISKHLLNTKGVLYFEINQYLGSEMKEMMAQLGYKNIQIIKDLNTNDRILKATF